MSGIIYLTEWVRQPQVPVGAKRQGIGRGLEFLANCAVGQDAARYKLATFSGSTRKPETDLHTHEVATTASTTNYVSWGVPSFTLPGPCSFAFRGKFLAASSSLYDRIFHSAGNQTASPRFGFYYAPNADATAPNRVYFDSYASDGTRLLVGYDSSHAVYSSAEYQTYVAVNDGTNLLLYCPEGVTRSVTTAGKFYGTPAQDVRFGKDEVIGGSGLNAAQVRVSGAAIWSRGLTANEAQSVVRNFWQLFAPLQRRIWVSSAAAPGGVFVPLIGRGPGMSLARKGGGLAARG